MYHGTSEPNGLFLCIQSVQHVCSQETAEQIIVVYRVSAPYRLIISRKFGWFYASTEIYL